MDTEGNRQNDGEVLEHHRSVGIFIKTCSKDLPWLDYCLKSIRKFGSGFSELVIMADQDCYGSPVLDNVDVRYCPVPANGYMYQQACKMDADLVMQSELILFVDSDLVFCNPFTPNSFLVNGKPFLTIRPYSTFDKSKHLEKLICKWKSITEQYTTWTVEYEYMQRMPIIHDRVVLQEIRKWHPTLADFVRRTTHGNVKENWEPEIISEFNLFGAFAHQLFADRYVIFDTLDPDVPPWVSKPYWSWGGITDEIRKEIEEILA